MDTPIALNTAEKKLQDTILASGDIERELRFSRLIRYVIAPAGCLAVLAWGYSFDILWECVVPAIGLAGLISAIGYARLMHYRLYRIVKSLSDESGSPAGR